MLRYKLIIDNFRLPALTLDKIVSIDRFTSGFGIFFASEDIVVISRLSFCVFVVILLVHLVT